MIGRWSRRRFLGAAAAFLAAPRGAEAQAKVVRIGVLAAGNPRTAPQWVAFDQRLRELGYVEGRNFIYDFRDAEGKVERLPDLADELARLSPDLIVASGPDAVLRAVQKATRTLPIVMVAIGYDPIALGYVTGLARPGGNITGLFFRQIELTAKRLELLKETLPRVNRVGVFWDTFSADQLKAAEAAARFLRVQLQPLEMVNPPYDFESAFRTLTKGRPGALLGLAFPSFFRERARVGELAIKHRLPAIFPLREYAEAGGLMTYGVSFSATFRRAAEYVDKILRGAKPADLPVEQPTKFELVINLKTAKALGLTIPRSLLLRADQVIE